MSIWWSLFLQRNVLKWKFCTRSSALIKCNRFTLERPPTMVLLGPAGCHIVQTCFKQRAPSKPGLPAQTPLSCTPPTKCEHAIALTICHSISASRKTRNTKHLSEGKPYLVIIKIIPLWLHSLQRRWIDSSVHCWSARKRQFFPIRVKGKSRASYQARILHLHKHKHQNTAESCKIRHSFTLNISRLGRGPRILFLNKWHTPSGRG